MRPATVAGRHRHAACGSPPVMRKVWILRVLGRPCDHLGIRRNRRQQHLGRPIRLAHALLPVAQRAQRDLVAIGEHDLRDLQPPAQAGHAPFVALGLAGEERLQLALPEGSAPHPGSEATAAAISSSVSASSSSIVASRSHSPFSSRPASSPRPRVNPSFLRVRPVQRDRLHADEIVSPARSARRPERRPVKSSKP